MRDSFEYKTAKALLELKKSAFEILLDLEKMIIKAKAITDTAEHADYLKSEVLPTMKKLRAVADSMETLTAESYWPMPTYGDLLFGVR